MSHLTQREIESLRPDLERIVAEKVSDNHSDVLTALEKCLYNGYDRKRATEKLSHWIDSKKASRLYDKLEDLVERRKNSVKLNKRSNEDVDDKVIKKVRTGYETNELAKPTQPTPTPPPPAAAVPPSVQISMMMANAQREIEERKKALSTLPANQEDVERAKKIAMLQAQIKAKLSGMGMNAIVPPVQEKPKPLILDDLQYFSIFAAKVQ